MPIEIANLQPEKPNSKCQEACISTLNGRLVRSCRQLPFGLEVQRISRLVSGRVPYVPRTKQTNLVVAAAIDNVRVSSMMGGQEST